MTIFYDFHEFVVSEVLDFAELQICVQIQTIATNNSLIPQLGSPTKEPVEPRKINNH